MCFSLPRLFVELAPPLLVFSEREVGNNCAASPCFEGKIEALVRFYWWWGCGKRKSKSSIGAGSCDPHTEKTKVVFLCVHLPGG
jgi:hypothetical protein